MLAILLLISLLILTRIITNLYNDWRKSFLYAAVIWGTFLAVITEILSWFNLIVFPLVLLVWLIFCLLLFGVYFKQKKTHKQKIIFLPNIKPIIHNLSVFLIILLISVVLITAIVGLIAIVAPPNTWDSMTYHMSRVVHWIQNRSVAHYPTYNLPQLFHPPFAEFAIMHLQILSGSDRFANLVQWFSSIGSIIGVSLIARELNANKRGQIFAAVFCATIPMGILQASSTQNDYVVGFWLVCLAYFVLLSIKNQDRPHLNFFVGASLGLSLLTKSSGYLYGFPFIVWFSLAKIWQSRYQWQGWKAVGLTTGITLLLNSNHYWRNFSLFNSIIGAPDNFSKAYKVEIFSVFTFISNVLRNLALHLDIIRNLGLQKVITPTTGIANKLLLMFHDWIGLDMYDSRLTAGSYRGVSGLSFDENTAGNPLHFSIILILISYFLLSKKFLKHKFLLVYLLATVSGFLLLCLLLKIQIYQPRHHLLAFLLLAAFVGTVLAQVPVQKLVNSVAILLIITSLPWVFQNKFRPIAAEANIFNMSRIEQYFINRPHIREPYTNAVSQILSARCTDIGLSLGTGATVGNEYWEYPLWVLFKQSKQPIRLENISPDNISALKSKEPPYSNFTPCAILAVRNRQDKPISQLVVNENIYLKKWSQPPVSVLMPEKVSSTSTELVYFELGKKKQPVTSYRSIEN